MDIGFDKDKKVFILSKDNLFNFVNNFHRYRTNHELSESEMTLSELIEKISNNSMMFDSWVLNIDVMN